MLFLLVIYKYVFLAWMSSKLNNRLFFAGSTNFCMGHAARMQSHQRTDHEAASVNYDSCSSEGVALAVLRNDQVFRILENLN